MMGPTTHVSRPAFQGYCDGHKVTYLNTDVSKKADAAAMHINYSATIGKVKGLPEIYLVEGRAASGQLAIFGSEPGEANYSPLWSDSPYLEVVRQAGPDYERHPNQQDRKGRDAH